MRTRLRVWKGEVEISDHVALQNGKANPFGWSQHELVYIPKDATGHDSAPEFIGYIESGYPIAFRPGFRFEIEDVVT